ncbi:STAS domain-containing protein [Steroidobacter sp. S1-65]|uniref:STAS domain-containing protein n=1 Tax=Steroidobacter gossypii TaxID=2805490 RepID=A0ABS1WXG1_9GAMM|nr:STAS domain-containing protein [Steroidobacter gossypii]MBM0105656.1 STAS domain-containing protein [Steroidobacter gossypii]
MLSQQTSSPRGEVRIDGEMTIYRASEVAQTLFAAVRTQDGDVRLDLSNVTEFDTAGLQVVLMARRIAAASGHRLDVVRPSEAVMDVLKLCNVPQHAEQSMDSERATA